MIDFITNCTGSILSGGENTRMPVLKGFIKVDGSPIIKRNIRTIQGLFNETFIVTNQPEFYTHLKTSLLGDIYNVRGPMTGIFTSLINASNRWTFISACDMPFLNRDLITYMASLRKNNDAVVPMINNRAEPLFAFYSKKLLVSMEKAIFTGVRGMNAFLKDKRVQYISIDEIKIFDPEARSFINLNTPEDVEALDEKSTI